MATTANIVDVIASEAGIPASVVAMKARYLTHASVLPKGGRGTGAPQLTSRDAANLILALAHDGPAVETAEAVRALGAYPVIQETKSWSFKGDSCRYEVSIAPHGGTLLDALAAQIDAARVVDTVSNEFTLCRLMFGMFNITQSGGSMWAQITPSMSTNEREFTNDDYPPTHAINEPVFLFVINDDGFRDVCCTPRTMSRRTSISFDLFDTIAKVLGQTTSTPVWPVFRRLAPSTEESK